MRLKPGHEFNIQQLEYAFEAIRRAIEILSQPLNSNPVMKTVHDAAHYISMAKNHLSVTPPGLEFPYSHIPSELFDISPPSDLAFAIFVERGSIILRCCALEYKESRVFLHWVKDSFGNKQKTSRKPRRESLTDPGLERQLGTHNRIQIDGREACILASMDIEAQDPQLMGCLAKLSALDSSTSSMKRKVNLLFGPRDAAQIDAASSQAQVAPPCTADAHVSA